MLGIGDGMVNTVSVDLLSWENTDGAADETGEEDGCESELPLDSDEAQWAALITGFSTVI